MKSSIIIFIVTFLQIRTQNVTYRDEKIISCIPGSPDDRKIEEYENLQIITDLTHLPLSDIAKRQLVPEQNGDYIFYLTCSWKRYEYQTKHNEVAFNAIEKDLREALVREVGISGPALNLSKFEAKRIVDGCRNLTGNTPGQLCVRVQNCIHKQIKHFGN